MTLLDRSAIRRGSDSTAARSTPPRPSSDERAEILSPEALDFVAELHGRFEPPRRGAARRRARARRRPRRHARLPRGDEGDPRGRLDRPGAVRRLPDRRVEITGPTDRKLVINALNSGAKGFMADFEDATAPTWENLVDGHVNLIDAIDRTITYDASDGKHYELDDETATLLVRPRGWHLPEKHVKVDGEPVSGALLDFGLYSFHNARGCSTRARPRTSTSRRWSTTSRRGCGTTCSRSPRTRSACRSGSIRATVLIETLPPRSRWTRSSTSCATTPTGSTPAAGTTSSR